MRNNEPKAKPYKHDLVNTFVPCKQRWK